MSDQQPDWDKITEGKIRHGIAVEAFGKGMELNEENMRLIEKWVQFIIYGYDGIKDILNQKQNLKDQQFLKDLVDQFGGEIVEETDEDYVKSEINKAVKTLGQKDKNKVLYQLKQGNITVDNLQACLDNIGEMKHF